MLDKVMDNITAKIRKAVVTPRMDTIPLTFLMTRKIPDFVKHFFDQEVESWLREESDKFTSNERFDYDMPEVRVLIDKIFDTLKQSATFHVNKFNQLLERAIKLEANYLIRPHETLTQFLFKDNYVITTMEVYDMLRYFEKFQYYKDALTDYFNLKYLREISMNQFEELIAEIDRQAFSKDTLNATLQTVKTILNFINEGRTPAESLPTDILYKAFEDRNLNEYAALMKQKDEAGVAELSFSDLESLLRTGEVQGERAVSPEKTGEEVSIETIADIETEKPEVVIEEISVNTESAVPYVEEIEEEIEEEEYEEEPEEEIRDEVIPETEEPLREVEEYEADEVAESAVTDEEKPSAIPSATAADQLADVVSKKIKGEHLEDLTKIITGKQRKKFIKKIFKKDEWRYQKFLEALNKINNWKQASAAIDEMLFHNGINPYAREALEFSDLIYNRYFPKDHLS